MKVKTRLAAVLVGVLTPALLLAALTPEPPASRARVEAPELPERIGPWVAAVEDEFSADEVSRMGVDSYRLRGYVAPDRAPIWLYVGLYSGLGGYGGKYHDPEGCYPGRGWEILDYRPLDVVLPTSEVLHTKQMQLRRGGEHQRVLYWFQPAQRWPAVRAAEELLRVLDAVARRPQYAFVRISGPMQPGTTTAEDLSAFAAAVAPAIRNIVDDLDPGSSAPVDRGER